MVSSCDHIYIKIFYVKNLLATEPIGVSISLKVFNYYILKFKPWDCFRLFTFPSTLLDKAWDAVDSVLTCYCLI